jgi:hypothetical protein
MQFSICFAKDDLIYQNWHFVGLPYDHPHFLNRILQHYSGFSVRMWFTFLIVHHFPGVLQSRWIDYFMSGSDFPLKPPNQQYQRCCMRHKHVLTIKSSIYDSPMVKPISTPASQRLSTQRLTLFICWLPWLFLFLCPCSPVLSTMHGVLRACGFGMNTGERCTTFLYTET